MDYMSNNNEITVEVTEVVNTAPSFVQIENIAQAEQVSAYLKTIRATRKKIDEFFACMRDNAHKAWKEIIARQDELDARPAELEAVCKRLLQVWQTKEHDRIRAEQARLDEEARQAAIATAISDGDAIQAKAIEDGKVAVISAKVVAPPQKIAGVTTRDLWQAEVVDFMALVKAVAAGKASPEYLMPNMNTINAVARSTKGKITIQGVVVRMVTGIASRQ